MEFRVGQQLGNYRLLCLLGQGGFSDVYLGEHLHLKTLAAIKVLQMRLLASMMEQFQTEAQAIASLVHPHIAHTGFWLDRWCSISDHGLRPQWHVA